MIWLFKRGDIRRSFAHHTQMILVEEMPEQSQTMEPIFSVSIVQFLENLQFFESRLVPVMSQLKIENVPSKLM